MCVSALQFDVIFPQCLQQNVPLKMMIRQGADECGRGFLKAFEVITGADNCIPCMINEVDF